MLRGDRVRKHAALKAINGSLTGINVETQRAKHAQRKSQNVNTSVRSTLKNNYRT